MTSLRRMRFTIYSLMCCFIFFFLMIRRPPSSTRTDTLFPYAPLFRSIGASMDTHRQGSSNLRNAKPTDLFIMSPWLSKRAQYEPLAKLHHTEGWLHRANISPLLLSSHHITAHTAHIH